MVVKIIPLIVNTLGLWLERNLGKKHLVGQQLTFKTNRSENETAKDGKKSLIEGVTNQKITISILNTGSPAISTHPKKYIYEILLNTAIVRERSRRLGHVSGRPLSMGNQNKIEPNSRELRQNFTKKVTAESKIQKYGEPTNWKTPIMVIENPKLRRLRSL